MSVAAPNSDGQQRTWHMAAVQELAEVLGKMTPAPEASVQRMMNLCPDIPDDPSIRPFVLGVRGQTALMGVAQFVLASKEQNASTLPFLEHYLEALPYAVCEQTSLVQQQSSFVRPFVSCLLGISAQPGRSQLAFRLVDLVRELTQQSLPASSSRVLVDTLLAFGSSPTPPLSKRYQARLVESLTRILEDYSSQEPTGPLSEEREADVTARRLSVMAACLQAMAQVVDSKIGDDVVLDFFERGRRVLSEDQLKHAADQTAHENGTPLNDLVLAGMRLVTRCGVRNPPTQSHLSISTQAFQVLGDFTHGNAVRLTPEVSAIFLGALNGMADIATAQPPLAVVMVEQLQRFLKSNGMLGAPGPVTSSLREGALGALHRALKEDETNALHLLSPLIFEFAQLLAEQRDALQGMAAPSLSFIARAPSSPRRGTRASDQQPSEFDDGDSGRSPDLIAAGTAMILGRIACLFNHPLISSTVLQRLEATLDGPPQPLDATVVEQMAEIALVSPLASLREVMEIMSRAVHRQKDKGSGGQRKEYVSAAVTNVYLRLARGLEQPELRKYFRQHTMALFCSLGLECQRKVAEHPDVKPHAIGNPMAELLPTLAEVMRDISPDEVIAPQSSALHADLQKLYQSVWFYCILFDFTEGPWADSTKKIAKHMPVLITPETRHSFNEVETRLAQFYTGLSEIRLLAMRTFLANLLPTVPRDVVAKLSMSHVFYVLSVTRLEMLRAESGFLKAVYIYLEDQDIAASNAGSLMRAVTDRVLKVFLGEMLSRHATPSRETILESQAIFLTSLFCSRYRRVREAADEHIIELVRVFPQIQYSGPCLAFLRDIFDKVAESCENTAPGEFVITLPTANVTLTLPEDVTFRMEILNLIVQLCNAWLPSAVKNTPMECRALLQYYLQDFRRIASGLTKLIGAKAATIGVLPPQYDCDSAWDHAALQELKARHGGEIEGMKALAGTLGTMAGGPQKLTTHFVAQFDAFNKAVDGGGVVDFPALSALLHRGVALLVSEPNVDLDLLHAICFTPVRVFTEASLRMAAGVWMWINMERPELELLLLTELCSLWDYTMERQMGLFNTDPKNLHDVDGAAPHKVWILYLAERFEAVKSYSNEQVVLLRMLLHRTLANPLRFSTAPFSLSARFRLLSLALRLLQTESDKDMGVSDLEGGVLRDRVYNSALSWFLSTDSHYRGEGEAVGEEVRAIVQFGRLLKNEKPHWRHSMAADKESDLLAIMDQDLRPLVSSLKRRRALLLCLIGHELDRLAAWHNPRALARLIVPEEMNFPMEAFTNTKKWAEFVETAWHCAPALAIQFALRLGDRCVTVRKEVEDLVAMYPLEVVHLPEAVRYVITPRNLATNSSALRHLLYWAAVGPTEAIAYLSKAFARNRLVTQYALRVLQNFNTETVVFYITQIVQALRHDRYGYIADFLVHESRQRHVVAHQVIWNMATYTKEEDGQFKDPGLGPIAVSLTKRILASMTDDGRKFYEEEFQFFHDVAAISGTLKPLKKQEEYKADPSKLRTVMFRELLKINLPSKRTYLPCDVTFIVKGIKQNAGACLKSAEKVPILVIFEVEKSDILITSAHHPSASTTHQHSLPVVKAPSPAARNQEEDSVSSSEWSSEDRSYSSADGVGNGRKSAKGKGKGKSPTSPKRAADVPMARLDLPDASKTETGPVETRPQGAIFKVGDDVRQDMIALQVISIFNDTYKALGLPVFLYPYKVIATGFKSGVIEVIPRCRSRDELGRANELDLKEYFIQKYGDVDTAAYQTARRNFVSSVAAYAVACYILQVKDRHNGNIMIGEDGHLIHIDFGFIIDSSPANNLHFEQAPFKFTEEYIKLVGDGVDTDLFQAFRDLCVRAFLAIRPLCDDIVALIGHLTDTDLPCFKKGKKQVSLDRLRERFKPTLSSKEACVWMLEQIEHACSSQTTTGYDKIQNFQGGIFYKPPSVVKGGD